MVFIRGLWQFVQGLSQLDDKRASLAYAKLLQSKREKVEVDSSPINPIPFMWDFNCTDIWASIRKWGYVDLAQAEGITFKQGCLHWLPMNSAKEYEVQIQKLGEVGNQKSEADIVEGNYKTYYESMNMRVTS